MRELDALQWLTGSVGFPPHPSPQSEGAQLPIRGRREHRGGRARRLSHEARRDRGLGRDPHAGRGPDWCIRLARS